MTLSGGPVTSRPSRRVAGYSVRVATPPRVLARFLADGRHRSYSSLCRALRLTESAGRHPNVGVFRPVCVSRVASVSVGHLTRLARFLSASNACSSFGKAVFTLPALIRRRKPSSRHLAQALLSATPGSCACVLLSGAASGSATGAALLPHVPKHVPTGPRLTPGAASFPSPHPLSVPLNALSAGTFVSASGGVRSGDRRRLFTFRAPSGCSAARPRQNLC